MSNSPAIVSPTAWLRASSKKDMAQPPWVNPFLGSSSGPPGDCMMPSSVTWLIAMIFLIIFLQFLRFASLGRTTPFTPAQERGKRLFEIDAAAATLSANRCETALFEFDDDL